MRIIVCGGRDFNDYEFLCQKLDKLRQKKTISCIISGAARGADSLGSRYANEKGIELKEFPVSSADWNKYGKSAGHRRNTQMLIEGKPEGVVAFEGGRGTANMIKQAKEAGIKVWEPKK
jgi:hypothetical protein